MQRKRPLIDDGVLTSFDIISLVSELNDAFDVDIAVEDLYAGKFNSAENMMELITKLKKRNKYRMAFISGKFLLFLAVFFLLYFVVPKNFAGLFFLAGSYVFYIVNSKTLTVFLIATTLAAFGAGLWLEHLNSSQKKALAAGPVL